MSSIAESRNRGFFSSKGLSGAFKKHHNHHPNHNAEEELAVADAADESSTASPAAFAENLLLNHHHHHNGSSTHLASPSFTSLLHPFKRRGSSRSINSISSNDSANITSTTSNDSESAASGHPHHHQHHNNHHHHHHHHNITNSSDEESSTSSQKYSLKKFFRKPVVDTSDKSMEMLLSKYGTLGSVLGVGAGGSVRLITRASDNRTFAVKEFRARKSDETISEYTKKCNLEYSVGSNLKHPNVIEVMDIISIPKSSHQFEIMEYCPYELFTVVMEANITRSEINCYFKQLCLGVQYLHSVGLAHRDLKLDNCVISAEGILKIIDFGSATVFSTNPPVPNDKTDGIIFSLGVHGSDPYLAPETLISNKFYDPRKVDIWSIGIVYCCMTLKRFPWKVPDDSDYSFKMYSLPDDVERDYVKSAETHKILLAKRRKELLMQREKEERKCCESKNCEKPVEIEQNDVKVEVAKPEAKTKETKTEGAKAEEAKTENVKTEEAEPEAKAEELNPEAKTNEVKPKSKVEEVKPEVKAEEVKPEVKAEEVKAEEVKPEVKAEEVKPEEVKAEEAKPEIKLDAPAVTESKLTSAIKEKVPENADHSPSGQTPQSPKKQDSESPKKEISSPTKSVSQTKPQQPKVYKGSYRLMRLLPHASRPLISKILTIDVASRANMDDIFKDEWFNGISCCSIHPGESGHTHSLVSNKH